MLPAGLGAAALATFAWGVYAPNSWLFGRAIGRGSRGLYLTFDDGPSPSATASILETLAEEEVPAAFFMVGDHVRRFPGLALQVAEAGHVIGNHTEHHIKLHHHGPGRIRDELDEAQAIIFDTTGVRPRSFRAPHGYRNPFVAQAAGRLRFTTFGWSVGVWDSDRPPPAEIRARVGDKISPGAIILLHDGDGYDPNGDRRPTAEALRGIIHDARAAGYDFRSIADLMA